MVEVDGPPAPKPPPRRLWPWPIGVWVAGLFWTGLLVVLFKDGVPIWVAVVAGVLVAIVLLLYLGGVAWRALSADTQRPFREASAGINRALAAGGTSRGRSVRRWAVGLFTTGLILGPVTYDFVPLGWPRIAALVSASLAFWVGLIWCWKLWRPDYEAETRFGRALAGVAAGVCLATAAISTQDTTHFQCTQSVQTRDGLECVGDYVQVPGPDRFQILLFAGLAATTFWIAVSTGPWKSEAAS